MVINPDLHAFPSQESQTGRGRPFEGPWFPRGRGHGCSVESRRHVGPGSARCPQGKEGVLPEQLAH